MFRLPINIYSRLSFQYSAAGLFTRRIESWNQTLYQVQTTGHMEWRTIDTAEFSPMGAFGFRQRLDRVFQDTSNKRGMEKLRLRLAEWLAREYTRKHPSEGAVTGVRVGQTYWATDRREMTQPQGAWVREPVNLEPSRPFKPHASFIIRKGAAVEEVASLKTPSSPSQKMLRSSNQKKVPEVRVNPVMTGK